MSRDCLDSLSYEAFSELEKVREAARQLFRKLICQEGKKGREDRKQNRRKVRKEMTRGEEMNGKGKKGEDEERRVERRNDDKENKD